MSHPRHPAQNINPLADKRRYLPVFQDFTFNSLIFKDIRIVEDADERSLIRVLQSDANAKLSSKIRCISKEEVDNLRPGDSLDSMSEPLSQNEIDALKSDTSFYEPCYFNSDIASVLFGIYEGKKVVGSFSLGILKIISETDTLLKIETVPLPGLGRRGKAHWSEIHSTEWSQFQIDLYKYFLDQSYALGSGKTLRIERFVISSKPESEWLKREDVIESRGGKTTPLLNEIPGIAVTRVTVDDKNFIYIQKG